MFGIRKGIKQQMQRIIGKASPSPSTSAAPPIITTPPPVPVSTQPSTPTPAPAPAPAPEPTSAPAPASASAPAPAPARSGIAAMIAAGAVTDSAHTVDLSVSYTSGPAAEAAAAAMATRDMLNTALDGAPYWGPVDNESARAKAAGQHLIIDQPECIQCGTCVENTEHVFTLPDDAKAVVLRQEGPMELIQDAIDACPVTCIHWTDAPQHYPQLNDASGKALDA